MKVIRKGKVPVRFAECGVCGAQLEFLPGEVKKDVEEIYNCEMKYWKEYGGSQTPVQVTTIHFVVCPECLSRIVIP